jgi:hypothetical protein
VTQKKLRELLAEKRITNSYGLAGHGNVIIYQVPYSRQEPGGSCFAVCRVGFQTNSNAAWYNHGNQTFNYMGRADIPGALATAKEWGTVRYGITDWVKNPFGDWMSKAVLDRRIAEILPPTTTAQGGVDEADKPAPTDTV